MASLGTTVSSIIAPNLQHWLGCGSWAAAYPDATVHVAPAAEGECLVEKLSEFAGVTRDRIFVMEPGGAGLKSAGGGAAGEGEQGEGKGESEAKRGDPEGIGEGAEEWGEGALCGGALRYRLLRGAPLMLNEVIVFHPASKTVIVADGFYSGYDTSPGSTPPNAFTRVWFKMTKPHWAVASLPSYRTCRVLSNGDPAVLMACLRALVDDWKPEAMVCAHGGRVPVTRRPGEALYEAWRVGVMPDSPAVGLDESHDQDMSVKAWESMGPNMAWNQASA